MLIRRLMLASLTAVCAAMVACHQITDNPDSPPTTNRGHVLSSVVDITWLADVDAVAKACAPTRPHFTPYACARVELASDGLTSSCAIYATEPKDFNDKAVIGVLGHELWHCFGATHQ